LESHYIISIIHLLVGLVLVFIAMKAFKKTKYPPMGLLVIGFLLIVLGDTIIEEIVESLMLDNLITEIIVEGIETSGFLVLILAVRRS
jgi:hypothetical protein